MSLSVTHRIAGGYGVVLALAIGIMLTGLIAIARINGGLNRLVENAMPMGEQAALMQASYLRAYGAVVQVQQKTKLDQLSEYEALFSEQQLANQTARAQLKQLAEDNETLSRDFTQVDTVATQFFARAPDALTAHRKELEMTAAVAKQRRKFGDMADEVESITSDWRGEARGSAVAISNIRSLAERALERQLAAALKNDENEIRQRFTDVDQQLSRLGSAQRDALSDSYQRFKDAIIGAQGLLASYTVQLESRQLAQTVIAELSDIAKITDANTHELTAHLQVLSQQEKTDAEATVSNSRWLLILFALVATGLATSIAVHVVGNIRQPLRDVVQAMKTVATGDLRVNIALQRRDELGDVADSLRELIGNLRDMLAAIHQNSEHLATAATQTSAIADDTLRNINQQKEQAEMVASAVTEMAATVDEVAKSANRTLQQVESTGYQTQDGQRVFDESSTSIKHLANEIERATDVISKVSVESSNIGSVLEVIRGVAEQTNLLALNAAIEAARAGEQGRGFAVVADEVRTLASRSQNSTAEINEIITRLQSGTREAVNTMADSRREAQSTVSNIGNAREALSQIRTSVDVIKDMSTQIASAADEQNAVTHDLQRNISVIADAAERNAQGARENQSASLELARLAEQQKQLTRRFVLA